MDMTNTIHSKALHVYLLDAPDKGVGTAFVSGLLEETSSGNGQQRPVVNAPVYLADAKDGCYISAGLTDDKGTFCFTHLLTGEYCLKVEHQGSVRCDDDARLKIDTDGLHLEVKAILHGGELITSISRRGTGRQRNPLDHGISFNTNPNLDGKLNLILNASFPRLKLEITDLSGWIVRTLDMNERPAGHTETLDLEDLEKGTYILEISTSRDRMSKQLVLQ
jgi:hypothetical protein